MGVVFRGVRLAWMVSSSGNPVDHCNPLRNDRSPALPESSPLLPKQEVPCPDQEPVKEI